MVHFCRKKNLILLGIAQFQLSSSNQLMSTRLQRFLHISLQPLKMKRVKVVFRNAFCLGTMGFCGWLVWFVLFGLVLWCFILVFQLGAGNLQIFGAYLFMLTLKKQCFSPTDDPIS